MIQYKKFAIFIILFILVLSATVFGLQVHADAVTYTMKITDVTYVETSSNISLTGIAPTFTAPVGDWKMEIPSTLNGKPVVALSTTNTTNGTWNSTYSEVVFPSDTQISSIGNYTFRKCMSLKYFEFPSKATTLGQYIFMDDSLTEVSFDESWTSYSFDMTSLLGSNFTTVKMPIHCVNLTKSAIVANATSYTVGTLDYGEMSDFTTCGKAVGVDNNSINPTNVANFPRKVKVWIKENYSSFVPYTIKGTLTFSPYSELESIVHDTTYGMDNFYAGAGELRIPEGVTDIGDNAFSYCKASSIILPNSLLSIGDYGFWQCCNITSIDIPDSVTSIGKDAFNSCSALVNIKLSKTMSYIPDYMFSYCTALTSISIPSNITKIGENAFYWASKLTIVTFNEGLETIGKTAFAYTRIQTLRIPNSVKALGEYCFSNNHYLTKIDWDIEKSNIDFTKGVNDNALQSTGITEIDIPKNCTFFPLGGFINVPVVVRVHGNTDLGGKTGANIVGATVYYIGNAHPRMSSNFQKVWGTSGNQPKGMYISDRTSVDWIKANTDIINVVCRDTSIALTSTASTNSVTLVATLTADGIPNGNISIYEQTDDGDLNLIGTQAASVGKTLTVVKNFGTLLIGNRKYIAKYAPADTLTWFACSTSGFFDKGITNTSIAETHTTSSSGDLVINPTVTTANGETPRGIIKIYQGENASGKLVFTGAWNEGNYSLQRKQIPSGDINYYLVFVPADVGQASSNCTFAYHKASIPTTASMQIIESKNYITLNVDITPHESLNTGEVLIYQGDELTGKIINSSGSLSTNISVDNLETGDNVITAVYRSSTGDYDDSIIMQVYNSKSVKPDVNLTVTEAGGYITFDALLTNYGEPLDGVIKIYKGYDNTGDVLFSGVAPHISRKYNIKTEMPNYGSQNYYAEFTSNNLMNRTAKNITSYSRDSKEVKLVVDLQTLSETQIRLATQVYDAEGNVPTKGILEVYRGSNTSGVRLSSTAVSSSVVETLVDRSSLVTGGNAFYAIYKDDTFEYKTVAADITYTKLSSGESGKDVDVLYGSYQEQIKALELQLTDFQKSYLLKLEELKSSLNTGTDLSGVTAQLKDLESKLGALNISLKDINAIKDQISTLEKLIKESNSNINFDSLKDYIDKAIANNTKEMTALIEKLNTKSLTETDLQKIKELIGNNTDYSKIIGEMSNSIKSLSNQIDTNSKDIKSILDAINNQKANNQPIDINALVDLIIAKMPASQMTITEPKAAAREVLQILTKEYPNLNTQEISDAIIAYMKTVKPGITKEELTEVLKTVNINNTTVSPEVTTVVTTPDKTSTVNNNDKSNTDILALQNNMSSLQRICLAAIILVIILVVAISCYVIYYVLRKRNLNKLKEDATVQEDIISTEDTPTEEK